MQQVMTVNSNKPATKTNVIGVGTSQPPVNNKKAVNKPLLIGNKISHGNNGHHPRAAKSWTNFTENAVYCIDNVCVHTPAEELTQFVSEIAVKVISCFEVKSRAPAGQRRAASSSSVYKTFRLYIVKSDSSKLLQPNVWPTDIIISPWFRAKPKGQSEISHLEGPTDIIIAPWFRAETKGQSEISHLEGPTDIILAS